MHVTWQSRSTSDFLGRVVKEKRRTVRIGNAIVIGRVGNVVVPTHALRNVIVRRADSVVNRTTIVSIARVNATTLVLVDFIAVGRVIFKALLAVASGVAFHVLLAKRVVTTRRRSLKNITCCFKNAAAGISDATDRVFLDSGHVSKSGAAGTFKFWLLVHFVPARKLAKGVVNATLPIACTRHAIHFHGAL